MKWSGPSSNPGPSARVWIAVQSQKPNRQLYLPTQKVRDDEAPPGSGSNATGFGLVPRWMKELGRGPRGLGIHPNEMILKSPKGNCGCEYQLQLCLGSNFFFIHCDASIANQYIGVGAGFGGLIVRSFRNPGKIFNLKFNVTPGVSLWGLLKTTGFLTNLIFNYYLFYLFFFIIYY